MTLDLIKQYLRVDYDDEDEVIALMQSAAEGYIINAVGKYDDTDPLARLLLLFLVGEMYKNRTYTVSVNEKNSYTVRSIIVQLQADEWGDEE